MTAVAPTIHRPEPICGSDSMLPVLCRIIDVQQENFNTRTFQLRIEDDDLRSRYRWLPGQFNMLYVPGVGEAAISITVRRSWFFVRNSMTPLSVSTSHVRNPMSSLMAMILEM